MQTKCKNNKGFSLAEAVMATVVLGVVAAGVLLPFTSGASIRAEGQRRTLGVKLASDLMEEIIRTPFEQIVTKYHGYTEPQGQIKDASGALFTDPAYANFSRGSFCVYNVYQPYFIIVRVSVNYNENEMVRLYRLVSK
jgi:type II secretory pathway pseudopilin PulG